MSKDIWMVKYERVFEDLDAGKIDRDGAVARLKRLGLDREEAEETADMHITGIGL